MYIHVLSMCVCVVCVACVYCIVLCFVLVCLCCDVVCVCCVPFLDIIPVRTQWWNTIINALAGQSLGPYNGGP